MSTAVVLVFRNTRSLSTAQKEWKSDYRTSHFHKPKWRDVHLAGRNTAFNRRPPRIDAFEDESRVFDGTVHKKSLCHARSSPLSTPIGLSSGDYPSHLSRISPIDWIT